MSDIQKMREFYRLKSVYRANTVDGRKESAAEHTWSCLVLADYFLDKVAQPLDRLHVFELLLYHDVVEIEAGDTALEPGADRAGKQDAELRAAEVLKGRFPAPVGASFYSLFLEFEELGTPEARFAKAIDRLDAQLHEADYKEDWKGWTKEFLVSTMEPYFGSFPEILSAFRELLAYFEEHGFFDQ